MSREKYVQIAANRRGFLKCLGATSIGIVSATIVDNTFGPKEGKVHAASYSDGEILNFALNLEYLEVEFYCMSTWGTTVQLW